MKKLITTAFLMTLASASLNALNPFRIVKSDV